LHKLGRRGNHARASPLVCGNRWKR
jgi:hypothetical protein